MTNNPINIVGNAAIKGLLDRAMGIDYGNNNYSGSSVADSPIDIPGTIVGTLGSVANTQQYMQKFARYNNYQTSDYGMAQMAADRYMSLKERIPMSIEYYITPNQKKEVVMYVNPEKITLSTAKVKQKVYTRGGIYFHHYGDDIWTLKISGTVGYSQMKGIEALEEVYFYSGTLLKYQNVDVSTVHTNKITSLTGGSSGGSGGIGGMLDALKSSSSPVGKYFGRVMNTVTDALGYTGTQNGDYSKTLGYKIFGGNTVNSQKNANLFNAIVAGQANLNSAFIGSQTQNATQRSFVDMMKTQQALTGDATFSKGAFNILKNRLKMGMGTTSSQITTSIASDLTESLFGGHSSIRNMQAIMQQLNSGAHTAISSILGMATGDFPEASGGSLPMSATMGNYYSLGTYSATELNSVVASVQEATANNTIDHEKAAANWSDIESELTDLYRPRQIIIYFDDRIYIGHFSDFSYTRQAQSLLIYYDMQFTVTRIVKVDKNPIQNESNYQQPSLGSVVSAGLANVISNKLFGGFATMQKNPTPISDIPPKLKDWNEKDNQSSDMLIQSSLWNEYRAQGYSKQQTATFFKETYGENKYNNFVKHYTEVPTLERKSPNDTGYRMVYNGAK